jgi:membrane peptidoglycan carboxypeptidase
LLLGCALITLLLSNTRLNSLFFHRAVTPLRFEIKPGASPAMLFPGAGPYDRRLGYAYMPSLIQRLRARNFEVVRQAVQSSALLRFIDAVGYAVYHEKSQAGLVLKDSSGRTLETTSYPSAVYRRFEEIPPLLINTLRFIEDRELLDPSDPYRNPALEWRRFAWAAAGRLGGIVDPRLRRGGASTLATQIEKYRHSPDGRTESITEKMRQIVSATARAYLDGFETTTAQREIVTAYLDSTPLGSRPGYGEVIGFGDAMSAWFGVDLAEVNRLLSHRVASDAETGRRAQVFKEALSLLVAQRRPSYYLNAGRDDLERLTDSYLRALASAGVIDPAMRDAALMRRLDFAPAPPAPSARSFVERRAVDAARIELMRMLGLPEVYSLDRMDLSADVSIDGSTQSGVAALLERLRDPKEVSALGLTGDKLLGDGDPGNVAWSVVLYERGNDHNLIRVHADSMEQPFDLNSGAKLILGSTAKLRTLSTYLGIIDSQYRELSKVSVPALRQLAATSDDPLRRWAADYLAGMPPEHRKLQPMLDAAMQRRYSASPFEEFFTGGGVHVFHNFEPFEDSEIPTVEQAFAHSINLAFVRLMREVIRHYEANLGALEGVHGSDRSVRGDMLRRFADQEGTVYLNHFYLKYAKLSPNEALEQLAGSVRPSPRRLAVIFRSVRPEDSAAQMRSFIALHVPDALPASTAGEMYTQFAPNRFSLNDLGYIAGVNPLELWLVTYLYHHPHVTRSQVIAASAEQRQQAYAWLLKTEKTHQQNVRIREMIEQDAFDQLLQDWKRQGYPFARLVPSLATVIGSSGDRPDALATLMGIILNDGVKQPTTDLEHVRFAADTPYETEMIYRPDVSTRVMSAEVAATLRRALAGVVDTGTAVRARGVFLGADGKALPIGGKTGTGDNRFESFGPGHQLIDERSVDRTATFVFFLGDRLYGTVTAFVPGAQAASYHFTSSLAVMLLKALAPELQALIERSTDTALTQPQFVSLRGEPAQRDQLSGNDIENLFESRAPFLSGLTSACRPERSIDTFSNSDPCADRAPAHAGAADTFADHNLNIGAQSADVQTAAVPMVRHLQTTHAITQPTDAPAGGMDDMTDQFRIDNGQTVRITLAQ